MTAPTPIRGAFRDAVFDLLVAAAASGDLAGASVHYAVPRADQPDAERVIYLGDVDGALEAVTLVGGQRQPHEDRFTLDVYGLAFAPGDPSGRDAVRLAAADLAAVVDLIADDVSVGDLAGLDGGAVLGDLEGPNPGPYHDGSFAGWRLGLDAFARYA